MEKGGDACVALAGVTTLYSSWHTSVFGQSLRNKCLFRSSREREWFGVTPHAIDDVDGEKQPGQIGEQHNR